MAQLDSVAYKVAIAELGVPHSTTRWFEPKSLTIDTSKFFSIMSQVFQLTQHDQLFEYQRYTDDIGITHARYHQYHKGIRIRSADYLVHSRDGYVTSSNGNIFGGLNVDTSVSMKVNISLRDDEPNLKYWTDDRGFRLTDAKFHHKEKRQIVITDEGVSADCIQLSVSLFDSTNRSLLYTVLVDRKSNRIVLEVPDIQESCESATVALYGGAKSIRTDRFQQNPNNYRTVDNCAGPNGNTTVEVKAIQGWQYFDITNSTNQWTVGEHWRGAKALWLFDKILNYWGEKHNRISYDNNNATVQVRLNFSNHAAWVQSNSTFEFGIYNNGVSIMDYLSLDVSGHEFMHAVTQYGSTLGYDAGETRALNESFSDIFGTCLEFYIDPNTANYLEGEESYARAGYTGPYTCARSLENPSLSTAENRGSSFYQDNLWYAPGYCDHCNAGVQNRWFYLLSHGGSGVTPNGQNYAVQGIGIDNAAKIAYRSLTTHLFNNAQYIDAMRASVTAAKELFGECSNEVQQTARAWFAVGVYYQYILSGWDHYITNATLAGATNTRTAFGSIIVGGSAPGASMQQQTKVNLRAGANIRFTNKAHFKPGTGYMHAKINPCAYDVFNNQPIAQRDNSFGKSTSYTFEQPTESYDIQIQPNPAQTSITIAGYFEQDAFVYSSLGNMVISISNKERTADISQLAQGTYYIRCTTPQGVIVKPFVIVR